MKHFLFICLVICSLFQVFWRIKDRFFPGTLRVTFFDVGQGDSTLVQFPKGSTLLVDAGRGFRSWDVGKAVLVRELGLRAILTLDQLLMTHPDQDHSYGLRGILSELRVKEFWIGEVFLKNPSPVLKERLELARSRNVGIQVVSEEVRREVEGVKVRYIPLVVDEKTNNNCLVTYFEFGKCRLLLTGDIEEKAERVLKVLVPVVDVLKIAHHGSKTSSSKKFLKSVRPKVGVISAGFQNRYGHPSPVVSRRLKDVGIEVFRTDFHGMTTFESDGVVWKCSTTRGSCGVFRCG